MDSIPTASMICKANQVITTDRKATFAFRTAQYHCTYAEWNSALSLAARNINCSRHVDNSTTSQPKPYGDKQNSPQKHSTSSKSPVTIHNNTLPYKVCGILLVDTMVSRPPETRTRWSPGRQRRGHVCWCRVRLLFCLKMLAYVIKWTVPLKIEAISSRFFHVDTHKDLASIETGSSSWREKLAKAYPIKAYKVRVIFDKIYVYLNFVWKQNPIQGI